MAIYRGPGGAGDAVADTDNQSEIAVTKAAEAAASATQSAASAAAASTSATNAANSASSASSSASTATSSASAASSAQTAAEAAQTAAEAAQAAAETAETNAETAETNAEAFELSANNWATKTDGPVAGGEYSAKYHALAAANSASAASSSATDAETAQTAAETAQTAAESAQAAAEATYDSFDDRYLGAKSSAPATDNDGDALLTGALYYNTTVSQLYIWDGTQWDDAAFSVSGAVTSFNTRTGAVTLSSADVTTALGYTPVSTETDPVVGAITGIVKANGAGTIAAAVAGTDYLAPAAIGSTVLAYDSNLQSFVNTFTLPTTDGTNGQALTTNSSGVLSFSNVDALPSQTGQSGKFLTTNGTVASWALVPTTLLVENRAGTGVSVSLANGFLPVTNRAGSTINVSVS
jgi:hypothetical protein